MEALARFIVRGPGQAALVAAGLSLLALVLPPLGLAGSAALALVMLRSGEVPALKAGVLAFAGAAVLGALVAGSPLVAVGLAVGQWLPVMGLAWVLRRSVSLPLAVLGAMGFGLLALVLMQGLGGGTGEPWRQALEQLLRPSLEGSGTGLSGEEVDRLLDELARLAPVGMAASVTLTLALGLMIARWWQALLDNPGGFRREFHALQLGRGASAATAAALAAAVATGQVGLIGLAAVLSVGFLLQGLAVAHALVAARGGHVAWLVAMYLLLAFVPQLALLPVAAGMVDAWVGLRRRAPQGPPAE